MQFPEVIFLFFNQFLAWSIALYFLGYANKHIFLWSSVCAFVVGGVVLIMQMVGLSPNILVYLLVFFFIAFAICLQERFSYPKVWNLFVIAMSIWTLNEHIHAAVYWCEMKEWIKYLCSFILLSMTSTACTIICKRLLPKDLSALLYDSSNSGFYREATITTLYFVCTYILLSLVKIDSSVNHFLLAGVCLAVFWMYLFLMSDEARICRDKIDFEHERNNHKDTENFMNTVRSQRHDYNFHLQTLSELIDRGDMDECKKYVDQLVEDSSIMNQILPVQDPAIAALINAFRIKAIQGGITLHIEIEDDLSHIATNEYETNKIIGNLLQNALDEIKTHQDKSYGIHLSILKRGEFNLIRVSNRVEAEHIARLLDDAIYKQGYTTKDNHDGVGLCSVRSLVRRYKGEIYTRIEDDIVYFVASVPIHYGEDL